MLRFLPPVSTFSARNASDHNPAFDVHTKKRNACIFRVSLVKQERLITKTTTLNLNHLLVQYCLCLPCHHCLDMTWKCLIIFTLWCSMEDVKKWWQKFLSFWTWIWFCRIQLQESMPTFEQVPAGIIIILIKIERMWINFLRNVSATVAIMVSFNP